MDIYKIKDREEASGIDGAEILRVTDLKQGVKNLNRVNVFINGVYTLSLDVAQVVDYKLKVGLVISTEKLDELRRASDFGKRNGTNCSPICVPGN